MKILLVIALILLGLILTFLVYLLIAPFKVVLDSQKQILVMGWSRWMSARLIEQDQRWIVKINTPVWIKNLPVEDLLIRSKTKKKKKSKSRKKRPKISWSRFRKILDQIEIKECRLNLDTDDFILNAYLTPVFELLSYKTRWSTGINFLGKNDLRLRIESRMIRMLKAVIF